MKVNSCFILAAIISVLFCSLIVSMHNIKTIKQQLKLSKQNELAYITENSSLKDKNIEYKYTIDQLNTSKDSLVQEIVKVKNQLKVKDKQLASLAYLQSIISIKDTVRLTDTIFVKNTKIDTIINNKWYVVGLCLEHPNMVGLDISVPSEKYIVSSYNKVLLNPSTCKVKNWLRRKSTIVEVEVVEKNPYIINNQQKFIEVIR